MDRRTARACAMKLVYKWLMGGDGGNDTLIGMLEIKPDEKESDFMTTLFEGVKTFKDELDAEIVDYLDPSWRLDRVSKVDYSILLVAVYELLHTSLSESIVINEAVELANIYSEDKAGAFVNGLLGSISRSRANA